MGAVMTRHLISCLAIVRQIRAAYDTGAGASDPKTNKQVVYSVQCTVGWECTYEHV